MNDAKDNYHMNDNINSHYASQESRKNSESNYVTFPLKYVPFCQILIFWALTFCKHPYFDSTAWFSNENIVLYEVLKILKFWDF